MVKLHVDHGFVVKLVSCEKASGVLTVYLKSTTLHCTRMPKHQSQSHQKLKKCVINTVTRCHSNYSRLCVNYIIAHDASLAMTTSNFLCELSTIWLLWCFSSHLVCCCCLLQATRLLQVTSVAFSVVAMDHVYQVCCLIVVG